MGDRTGRTAGREPRDRGVGPATQALHARRLPPRRLQTPMAQAQSANASVPSGQPPYSAPQGYGGPQGYSGSPGYPTQGGYPPGQGEGGQTGYAGGQGTGYAPQQGYPGQQQGYAPAPQGFAGVDRADGQQAYPRQQDSPTAGQRGALWPVRSGYPQGPNGYPAGYGGQQPGAGRPSGAVQP